MDYSVRAPRLSSGIFGLPQLPRRRFFSPENPKGGRNEDEAGTTGRRLTQQLTGAWAALGLCVR
jgi:hypothetical protein